MELPARNTRVLFNNHINKLLDDMQDAFDDGTANRYLSDFQDRLDGLAAKYQNNEHLGRLKYKLYEAQAYIHYLRHDNAKALEFIDEAISLRGGTFSSAEELMSAIESEVVSPQSVEAESIKPIDGWLALFTFGLGIGVLYNLYEGFTGWNNLNSLTPDIESAYPGIHNLLLAEQIVPIVSAVIGIAVIGLILQRKHVAKALGITLLAGTLLWVIIDYSIASAMFASNSAVLNSINSAEASSGHTVLFTIIWLLYLIFSKQVKTTLTVD